MPSRPLPALALACLALSYLPPPGRGEETALTLTTRSRRVLEDGKTTEPLLQAVRWDPKQTAVIICDMWDQHWCEGANRRGAAIAPRINEFVKAVRARGGTA